MAPDAASARVAPAALEGFVARILASFGVPAAAAATVAARMVEADLRGYDSHGVFRLRQYADRLAAGSINPRARPRLVEEAAAVAVVDGDDGFGHLAMDLAVATAVAKAEAAGIGWVGLRRSNHAGPLAVYVRPMVERGMIGLAGAVGGTNHVPPTGGRELLLGTNPLAVAVPAAGRAPFLLDMATTVASSGKIKRLAQRGEAMPAGWMIDRDGRPLTDPTRQAEGFLLPIGGAKGYGLALAVALLGGVLNGARTGRDILARNAEPATPPNAGQFVAAIRLAAFGDPDTIAQAAAELLDDLERSAPLEGDAPVRVPGAGRDAARAERSAHGIPVHPALRRDLDAVADARGVARLPTA
jgi:LDH2 family malate/lactate/ureidoglycolate dehydrogenase